MLCSIWRGHRVKARLGFHAQRDPNFQSLHADPEFVALTQQRRSGTLKGPTARKGEREIPA